MDKIHSKKSSTMVIAGVTQKLNDLEKQLGQGIFIVK